jgi:hypothetical protein
MNNMQFSKFEVVQDLSDGRTEVIKNADVGLYLTVIPEDQHKDRYASDAMIFVAKMRRRGLSGRPIGELTDTVHLKVMKHLEGNRSLWSADLLIEAVRYYCVEYVGSPAEQIQVHFNGRLLPFDDSYGFIDND